MMAGDKPRALPYKGTMEIRNGSLQMFRLFGMGNDPVSGEQLGNRPYRIDADGRGSVAGFDLTFSAPKSVSIISTIKVLSPRARLSEAPMRVKILSTTPIRAEVAGTKLPI